MKALKGCLLACVVALPLYSHAKMTAEDPVITATVLADSNFKDNKVAAIEMLKKRGYQVHSMTIEAYRGNPVFRIKALKPPQKYVILMTYPELKIIEERRLLDEK